MIPSAYNYTTQSIVNDLLEILRQTKPSSIIIVSHSYGTRIGVKLLLEHKNEFNFKAHVMLSPKSHISEHERKAMTKLLTYSDWFVDVLRFMDRIGGIHSGSVKRMLSPSASIELRRQQLIWNKASPTSILKHYLRGMQWAGKEEYNQIQLPTLIVGGSEDAVTPISPNVDNITEWMPTAQILIIKRVGHNLMLQDPVETNSIIHKFLKDNDLI
jgi:pimeloyl-ACP methyl ester carboxylesterase